MKRVSGLFQKDLKNRSSKHLRPLTGHKPVVRRVSNAQLSEWANMNIPGALAEVKRRIAHGRGTADKFPPDWKPEVKENTSKKSSNNK